MVLNANSEGSGGKVLIVSHVVETGKCCIYCVYGLKSLHSKIIPEEKKNGTHNHSATTNFPAF